MSRIVSIIKKARYTLADGDKDRWSDERLLSLIDEGVEDIALHSSLLKETYDIALASGQSQYDIPDTVYLILRASVDGREIPLTTYTVLDENARRAVYKDGVNNYWERSNEFITANDFDSRSITWEMDTGSEVEALVYDNRNPTSIRVYPIPNDSVITINYTFENAGTVIFAGDKVFGTVVDVEQVGSPDYTFDSPYGVVADFYDPEISSEVFDSGLGVVTSVGETTSMVTIWYIRAPNEIVSLTDIIPLPPMYDKALKFYVIAHAYDDDYDTRHEAKSQKALSLYQRELELAKKHSRKDGVHTPNHRTQYRSAFE